MPVEWHCDKAEAVVQAAKRYRSKKLLPGIRIGGYVAERRFPRDIQGTFLSVLISGTVARLWETEDAGWATVLGDDGVRRIVCLG